MSNIFAGMSVLLQGSHLHCKNWKRGANRRRFFQSGKSQGISTFYQKVREKSVSFKLGKSLEKLYQNILKKLYESIKNGKVREFLERKKVGALLLSFLMYNSAAHLLTDLNTNLLYWVSHRISVE